MNQAYQILKNDIQSLIPDCQVYLFGSRANNTNNIGSDYDILIITAGKYSVKQKFAYKSTLRKLFAGKGLDTDLLIESVDEVNIKKELYGHIIRYAYQDGIKL